MEYRRCGASGLQLSRLALGLWHNFGKDADPLRCKSMLRYAFEQGITHFDLANNYGPPPGSAEINFGRILKEEFASHRDEMIITTKAGHEMWPGPYGDGASRKSLMSSLDQSLKRMQLDYVDIFYSHRYDAQTPIEETMQALSDIVRQGKALYVGISKYPPEQAQKAFELLKANHTPCLIYQDRYNMLVRKPEEQHLDLVAKYGIGFIAFSPLAQGQLTDKYLHGIPEDSRAAKNGFLTEEQVSRNIDTIKGLQAIAIQRGQTLAEMALAWLLKDDRVNSVIIGVSSKEQVADNLKALENTSFSEEELQKINQLLS
ncbi:MAG: aldo/keto reductase [Bacteroidales bacterium]|nr:aldo/keto reductase [Bacteroidales bacterium]